MGTREAHAGAGGRLPWPRSAGRAVRCNEIEIVDRDGTETPRGTIGEIRVRGATAMLGYWQGPPEAAAALCGGWIYTGDAGYRDEAGNLFVIDRLEDVIFSGGETISSLEVENAIAQHPAVAQCAVIGVLHEHWGEAVHAIIVCKPGRAVTADAIIAHCRRLIAGHKCPRSVSFRGEELPLSTTGQPLKRALRPSYRKGRCRQPA
jgi:long-chain acyl-CoA synthetase